MTFDNPEECKKSCHMIALQLHALYLKCLTVIHLNICYHPYIYQLTKPFTPMSNQIAFRQYNHSKPHNYELLFNSLNNVSFPHTDKASPYAGKSKNVKIPYYINLTETHVRYLLDQTKNNTMLQGKKVPMDSFCTNVRLANWLLSRNKTCVRTLNHNRQIIPAELEGTSEQVEF